MESLQHIRKSDLARKTRQVLEAVQHGFTVVLENQGQPQAVLVDIVDYHVLRAVRHYYARRPARQ